MWGETASKSVPEACHVHSRAGEVAIFMSLFRRTEQRLAAKLQRFADGRAFYERIEEAGASRKRLDEEKVLPHVVADSNAYLRNEEDLFAARVRRLQPGDVRRRDPPMYVDGVPQYSREDFDSEAPSSSDSGSVSSSPAADKLRVLRYRPFFQRPVNNINVINRLCGDEKFIREAWVLVVECIGGCPWLTDTFYTCLLYTSPSPRDLSTSRMPSSA